MLNGALESSSSQKRIVSHSPTVLSRNPISLVSRREDLRASRKLAIPAKLGDPPLALSRSQRSLRRKLRRKLWHLKRPDLKRPDRRYRPIQVSDEEAALVGRLRRRDENYGTSRGRATKTMASQEGGTASRGHLKRGRPREHGPGTAGIADPRARRATALASRVELRQSRITVCTALGAIEVTICRPSRVTA